MFRPFIRAAFTVSVLAATWISPLVARGASSSTSRSQGDSLNVTAPLLLGGVDVSASDIVFGTAGDLWAVPLKGGRARPLTTGPAEDDLPVFSPDGSQVAFTRTDGSGGADVWIVPAEGGEARQVTFHPKAEVARDWTPDGKSILMTCGRDGDRLHRLYTGPASGGPQTALPLPSGYQGSLSPDGSKLVYQPRSIPFETSEWRYYRGGSTSPLWIVDLATGRVEDRLPRENENLRHPMWHRDRIYYASDATGTMNLHEYDPATKQVRALTSFRDHGIQYAGLGPSAIAFTRAGGIHLFDLRTRATRDVKVSVRVAAKGRAPRETPVAPYVTSAKPSPTGNRLLIEARGDIFVLDRTGGSPTNLTRTPGVAERDPVWSPDETQVAYFSDESGEYAIHVRPVGGGAARVQKIRVDEKPTFYRGLEWSPDGKRLSFSDQMLQLRVTDIDAGTTVVVDRSEYVAQGAYRTTWSPDGTWLAYAKADSRGRRAIRVYNVRTRSRSAITDSLTHADHPVFDRSGRYLFLTSSPDARLASANDVGWALLSSYWYEPIVSRRLHVAVLSGEDLSPFVPGPFTPTPGVDLRRRGGATRIDVAGLERRILPLPSPRRDYVELAAGEPGIFFARTVEWPPSPGVATSIKTPVVRIDLAAARDEKRVHEDVDWFQVGNGGRDLVYGRGDELGWLRFRADGAADTLSVTLDSAMVAVDPPVEWRQMVRETWRLMRDTFYDPALHGQNVAALERETASYLPGITRRRDLNTLLRRMLLQVSVSHLRVGGGDEGSFESSPPAKTGDLGVDLEPANGKLRMVRVYRNGPFALGNPGARAPLDVPGLNIQDGEFLLAIEGKSLEATDDVYRFLVGTAGKPTRITVGPNPDGNGSRTLTVVPAPGTNVLRRIHWAEENRKRVLELSHGRVGYVYVPDYGSGIDEFLSGYLGLAGRVEALVFDQRFSPGGITPDVLIAMLRAEPWYAYRYRYGADVVVPPNTFEGPKVLLIHESNGSAAETGALMAKLTGAATLVGMPTYGAGIGAALDQPGLIDGGQIAIPNRAAYDPAGSWGIENVGVQPDVRVEVAPESFRASRDPQLEAAVQAALQALDRKAARRTWIRPKTPVHP